MDYSLLLTWAPPMVLVLVWMTIMFVWLLLAGRRIRRATETRYDYKVVDILILQNPENHEEQIQKWADEGWRIVACIPLTGGAVEGAPEVRYVISRPWEPRRLSRTVRVQAKAKKEALKEERRLERVQAAEEDRALETPKPADPPVQVPVLVLEKNLTDRLTPEEG